MRVLGFEITRAKAVPPNLVAPYDRGNWWFPVIREPRTQAWQRGLEERPETILAYHAVYSCVTLIASDVGKLRLKLVEQDANGIWQEVSVAAFSPVLRKPNRYQNRIQFIEQWLVSKLLHGNTYVLKERDNRGVVVALYVLDPTRTKPLVAPDGSVFYQLVKDNLAGVEADSPVIPASEIIHDVMVALYHPLCGISPLSACGLPALQALRIQENSTRFFENGQRPGGILTAPGPITNDQAARLKETWDTQFTGANSGKVAVLGDGLKYESMSVNASDAQLIEQLQWDAKAVCSAFHVPGYMVGVGEPPSYNNIEALNQQYYSQCLQKLIEAIELLLDEGLGLTGVRDHVYGTEFDLDDLLRMDTATRVKTASEAIKGGLAKPNEQRRKFDLPPVEGGDQVYLQQQNYSLAALAKRDAKEDPFSTGSAEPKPAEAPTPSDDEIEDDGETARMAFVVELRRNLALREAA